MYIILRCAWAELYHIWENIRPSSALTKFVLDFSYPALFRNTGCSKASGVENNGQILHFLPVFCNKIIKGATYDDHLSLIGKRVVDFLLLLIELFSLGVTAESTRAKRDRKSAISLHGVG